MLSRMLPAEALQSSSAYCQWLKYNLDLMQPGEVDELYEDSLIKGNEEVRDVIDGFYEAQERKAKKRPKNEKAQA